MKSLLLVSLLFTLSYSVSAQFSKGDKILGGSINFGYTNLRQDIPNPGGTPRDPKSKALQANINPSLGFFTSSSTVHGFRLAFGMSESRQRSADPNQPDGKTGYISFGGGYFFRKYKSFNGNFGGFAEAGLNYSYGTSKYQSPNSHYHQGTVDTKLGMYYAIDRRLMIEAALGVVSVSYRNEPQGSSKYHTWNVGGGFSSGVSLGVQFLLHK